MREAGDFLVTNHIFTYSHTILHYIIAPPYYRYRFDGSATSLYCTKDTVAGCREDLNDVIYNAHLCNLL